MSEGNGRARGRARGRSRGQANEQTVRRPEGPGQRPPQQQMAPPPPALGATAAVAAPVIPSGRAAHRGGSRAERQEPQLQGLVEKTGAMGLEMVRGAEGGNGKPTAGRGSRRGRMEDYDPEVRPSTGSSKQGAYGQPVKLLANYFPLERVPNMSLYQYHVTFSPEVENIGMRKGMVNEHRPMLGSMFLFDGGALWTAAKLEHEVTEVYSQRRTDSTNIRVQFKFIREIAARDPVVLQILNIQMRKNFNHMKFQLLGRDYYDMEQVLPLDRHRMKLYPGFLTSIRQHESSVMMCTDLSFKVVRTDTVLSAMEGLNVRDPRSFQSNCEKMIMGMIVLTSYNNRTYRIDEIDWQSNPMCKFKLKTGSEVTYVDYMQQTWNLRVNDARQPLLVSKPKARDLKRGDVGNKYLIPEFCVITGLDEEIRANQGAMKDMAQYTRVDPSVRVEKLQGFANRMRTNPQVQTDMNHWGLGFSQNLVQLQARQLGPESIILTANPQDKGAPYNEREADWGRNVRGARLLEPIALSNWILMSTTRNRPEMEDFLQNMRRVCGPMGINLGNPTIEQCPDDRTGTFNSMLQRSLNESVQMVVVIVPNVKKDRYDAIKKLCCVDYGIPSQVVCARTLGKKQMLMSIATKIAIQMNCKLGGQVWRVAIPLSGLMIVGVDSYHDSSQKNMSVAATVCSMNDFFTKFHSQVAFQSTKQEMLDTVNVHITNALHCYRRLNNKLPTKIVIYRDGVGDGQLDHVRQWEIKQLQQSFKNFGDDYEPKVVFIVVNKRINTRFFKPTNGGGGPPRGPPRGPPGRGPQGQFENPVSGTVIDTVVTRPERYDFFLISQSVRQGTVGPTQYNVIYDTSGLAPDHVQRLTYKMCHLYYNWQGTIRVPAPCQYAHKLAFLTGQSLHTNPNQSLANLLFYL